MTSEAPYDELGNLLHHPREHLGYGKTAEWRPNTPFDASLSLKHVSRGRSAAYFVWEDDDGHSYPMFLTDLEDLLVNDAVVFGCTYARTWVVRKRGQNYGIRLSEGVGA